tara:strand:+ start:118 stop:609 length:492 start_codon:yes stop_codon:yes gene_type:complete
MANGYKMRPGSKEKDTPGTFSDKAAKVISKVYRTINPAAGLAAKVGSKVAKAFKNNTKSTGTGVGKKISATRRPKLGKEMVTEAIAGNISATPKSLKRKPVKKVNTTKSRAASIAGSDMIGTLKGKTLTRKKAFPKESTPSGVLPRKIKEKVTKRGRKRKVKY